MFHFAHDYTDKHKYAATLNPIIHLGCLALVNEWLVFALWAEFHIFTVPLVQQEEV